MSDEKPSVTTTVAQEEDSIVIPTVYTRRDEEPEPTTLVHQGDDNSPGALLRLAITRDLGIEKIEKMLELQERWEANEARKAYVAAMTEFKKNPPLIIKDRHVSFRNSKNQLVEYDHSSLAQVVAQCIAGLGQHGFHHDWKTSQERDSITVICIITHCLGHRETCQISAPKDTSGSKNAIQAIASTITYLERYTLLMALGLAPADDDDGRGAMPQPGEGEEEPPVHQDPEPNARARKAIDFFGQFLGQENARGDLERYLVRPAGLWDDSDIKALLSIWHDVRELKLEGQAITDELRKRLQPGADEGPPPDDEPPPPPEEQS